jgi:hypothetical protein
MKRSLFVEFLAFIKEEKMWWMIPLLVVGAILAVLLVAAQHPAFAPFVYPIF